MQKIITLICLLSFSCCFGMDQSSSGNELEKLDSLEDLPEDVEAQSSSDSSSAILESLGVNKKTLAGHFLHKRITAKKETRSNFFDTLDDSQKAELYLEALHDCDNHYSKRKKQVTWGVVCCSGFWGIATILVTALAPTAAHLLTKEACD